MSFVSTEFYLDQVECLKSVFACLIYVFVDFNVLSTKENAKNNNNKNNNNSKNQIKTIKL